MKKQNNFDDVVLVWEHHANIEEEPPAGFEDILYETWREKHFEKINLRRFWRIAFVRW